MRARSDDLIDEVGDPYLSGVISDCGYLRLLGAAWLCLVEGARASVNAFDDAV